MFNRSNSYMLSVVTKLLILLVIAKVFSLVLWWFLPSDGVELQLKKSYKPKYQRVDFRNMLDDSLGVKVKSKNQISPKGINITNMILKGLYTRGSKGFAIIALKSSPKKTSILSVGDEFSGYTLKTILSNSVVFTRANKDYMLRMKVSKAMNGSKISVIDSAKSKGVSRNDITYYAKNPKEIWKDISIVEVKDGKKIKGFKVTRVKQNSKMASLGLKKGDLIIKANNIELKSYRDALNIYKNIDKLETIQIVVMRENQEEELVYEIN